LVAGPFPGITQDALDLVALKRRMVTCADMPAIGVSWNDADNRQLNRLETKGIGDPGNVSSLS
jgi:hypothetical protein